MALKDITVTLQLYFLTTEKHEKLLFLLTLLSLNVVCALAQTRIITGRVVDNIGQPVNRASVLLRGTTIGTSANSNGEFSINAKTGDVFVISAVGIPSKKVTIGKTSNVLVSLPRQNKNLAEVVVTAAGITRIQRWLGYATATLKGDELTKARETNIVNSLAGKVAGVRITSQSGT